MWEALLLFQYLSPNLIFIIEGILYESHICG
jgi:hypothetical protein